MNLSGEAVHAVSSFYKIKTEEIIVVHDELELPLGTISLKFSGGLGGHNGLRSMNKCFGNADFWRIRIGIGRPDARLPGEGGPAGSGVASKACLGIIDWVLTDFSKTEQEQLIPVFDAGAGLLNQLFTTDPETMLDEWKKKKISINKTPENKENIEV